MNSAAAAAVAGKSATEISALELKARLDRGDKLVIVDVREPHEYQINRIPGSVLIPLGEIPRRYAELDQDAELVMQCKMGGRSAKAADYLRTVGFKKVLNLTGKKRLATDGIYGKGTAAAVKSFQATVNLPQTGTVDRPTWDALGLTARPELAVMKKGTKHPAVKTVQRALAKVLKTKIQADGIYGPALVTHVKTFQKRSGLPVTGRVGPSTWSVLMATAERA